MERVAFDVEIGNFGVAHLNTLDVIIGVEFAANHQAGLCRGCGNQLDDSQAAYQRAHCKRRSVPSQAPP